MVPRRQVRGLFHGTRRFLSHSECWGRTSPAPLFAIPCRGNLDTYDLSWSPDGSKIRFTRNHALWEVSSSGANLHQLLPGWHSPYLKCCGRWTPDGEFFLFISGNTLQSGVLFVAGAQIWAIDERRGRLRPPIAQPIQLTSGPIDWGTPIPSRDGKRIFAQGVTPRGELVRYDRQSNQFQPYLGGISAEFVAFSKDGRYVAYVSFPDGILWRANRDGTGLMQLSQPPFHPTALRWSPDGSQILFIDNLNDVGTMFVVPAQGGTPTRVLPEDKRSEGDATWSSDGKELVYDSHSLLSYSAWSTGQERNTCSRRWSVIGSAPSRDRITCGRLACLLTADTSPR